MSNRLADQTSPYLLQHKDNPVDWNPWDEEALARSKEQQKPIFLSIGYSACHWCHVMEHESFENETIAAELNDKFVCIKVDREERPDLDQLYMQAVQMMTGRGGWPMSIFLTPELKPFYGGTYWPPMARQGMPGFDQIIAAVDDAWKNRREQAILKADEITSHLQNKQADAAGDRQLPDDLLRTAAAKLEQAFDPTYGGFGSAPKFPHPMAIQLLLRIWHRHPHDALLKMVCQTLDKMAQGGIFDHLGGGFSRYSVDARWLVPHFEKMLYDNALLAGAYLDGYLATGETRYADVVQKTLDYVLTDLTDSLGGFHSTEDADSQGEEGKFYVWTSQQILSLLGREKGERFCYVYDISEQGNFEGKNIPNLPKTIQQAASLRGWDSSDLVQELAQSRDLLLSHRNLRTRPEKDDKILANWNGLMIDALARASAALRKPQYLDAARGAVEFILSHMQRNDGRLYHCWRLGQAKFEAYLDDYACLVNALLTLYESEFKVRWLDEAVRLAEIILKHFGDPQQGGFFYTADDAQHLLTRTKDLQDSSIPSGNAMACTALLRLGRLTGRQEFLNAAEAALKTAVSLMEQAPTAMAQMLIAADMYFGPTQEIAIIGQLDGSDSEVCDTKAVLDDLHKRYIPNRVVAFCDLCEGENSSPHLANLFQGKQPKTPLPTIYLCEHFVCQSPVNGKDAAIALWQSLSSPGSAR